ncbi:hypothetical protein Q4534_06375 [Cyclobacterium sp. 1_MG-2023]|uniref:hypothetical protein n=1 Tax=Cyclobacterium sp. 1_MG-2023 TaxID=3062681 RepID=UPI0026E12286|nr:hypothetical protein [Cyclobacterium sp. 1_MG-2023]MDO6437021.1 hypothetical protein [Cyclobacterium sp. 1_MG-2023]
MEKSIKEGEVEKLSEIEVTIKGVSDLETAIKILYLTGQTPEGFDAKSLNNKVSGDSITLYFPICCWRTGGRWVYGSKYNGLCHYIGEGCPA